MACCTHWARETLIVCFVVCSLQYGCTTTHEKHIYFNNSQVNWWDARANCQANEGDLFVPVTVPKPSHQSGTRNPDTYYWLGAMRYSTWTWTDDDSPLYINSRYSDLPADTEPDITFPDNSVYRCHRYCGSQTHALGLSRDRCFCVDDDYDVSSNNTSGEQCPGNLDELCGDANRMSVYKSHLESIPTDFGQCGYAEKEDNSLTISLDTGYNCYTKDRRYACFNNSIANRGRYICSGKVCLSKNWRKQTWTEANDQCKLVKLDDSNVKVLKERIFQDTKYWIGLVYRPNRKWITGQVVSVYDESSSSEPQCLTVSYMTWYPLLSWKPCSSPYSSICEIVRPKTSTTTVTPQKSSSTAAATTASETPTYQPASKVTQTGVFIGLGCVVLVLVVIIVVFLLMRQNKLCLNRKDIEQRMHFNPATQNTTSDLDVPPQTNTSTYTDITLADMADAKPMSSAVPMATVRPRVQTYDNTFPSDGDENDYNVLSQPGKHKTPGTPGKPINNPTGPDKGDYDTEQAWGQGSDKGDYDTAQALGQGSGSTGFNNSGLPVATGSPKISQGENSVVGQHDPGGTAEVYDHLRDATSEQGKTPREVDNSYSHVGRINKGFDDDAYDVARARQTEDRCDIYNHTNSVEDIPGDTNDYYNTRSLFRDNNESLGRQDDITDNTETHTLAKRISEA